MTDERPKDVHETEEVATASTRRRKPWQRSSLFVILFLGLVVVLLRIGFDVWVHVSVPADTPRIAMTFDDSWLSDLGITRATYEQVIARAGGRLLELAPVANTQPADEQRTSKLLANADGLLLTGGGDVAPLLYGGDPGTAQGASRLRDDFELSLIREARRRSLPILGICRGCQILNVAQGGTLHSLRASEEQRSAHFNFDGHSVRLEADSRLARILKTESLETVQSFHGQAVATPGTAVRVAARSEDGTVEAIEVGDADQDWIVAVQWHPELTLLDEQQLELLRAFILEAREARERRRDALE